MQKSTDNSTRSLSPRFSARSWLTGACLLVLGGFLMGGCEGPAGPPGARNGGPPGAPERAPAMANSPPGNRIAPASNPMPRRPDVLSLNKPSMTTAGKLPVAMTPVANAPAAPSPAEGVLGALGIPTSNSNPPNALTPEKKPDFTVTSKVEQAGNEVSLAVDLVTAKANPFLDQLPKPLTAEPAPATDPNAGAPATAAAPPANPLDSVSLQGIAYNPKSPLAMIAVSGGETQSQIVSKGSVLMMDGGSIRVIRISRDSVDFQRVVGGKGKNAAEKRTFTLPSIIGYTSTPKTDAAAGAAANAATPDPVPGRSAAASTSAVPAGSGNMADLSNLKKLLNPTGGALGIPSGPAGAPNVNLKEP